MAVPQPPILRYAMGRGPWNFILGTRLGHVVGLQAARTHLPSGSSAREAVGSVIAKALEKYVRAQRDDATAPITIISAAKVPWTTRLIQQCSDDMKGRCGR